MANKANGITYHLRDDCDTLLCKLDNAAFESFMEGEYEKSEKLEEARDRLEVAINRRDREAMQAILDEYHGMFKRYS
jgi:hypothetical protein